MTVLEKAGKRPVWVVEMPCLWGLWSLGRGGMFLSRKGQTEFPVILGCRSFRWLFKQ